jgi:hypothetical protein
LRRWETISLVTAEYSLVERGVERENLPLCVHEGLALMPWSPLGGGLLSGKYRGAGRAPVDTRAGSLSNSTATVRQRLANDRNHAIAENVRHLNWAMHRPAVAAPVVGVRTSEQLADNLGAAGWVLEDADRAWLDTVSATDLGYPAEWTRGSASGRVRVRIARRSARTCTDRRPQCGSFWCTEQPTVRGAGDYGRRSRRRRTFVTLPTTTLNVDPSDMWTPLPEVTRE